MTAQELGAKAALAQPELTFATAIRAEIAAPLVIGQVDGAVREIFPITGGEARGPLITGRVVPGGADWALRRADGSYRIEAKYCIELTDGTLITVVNAGRMWPQPDGSFSGRTKAEIEVGPGPHEALGDMIFFGTALAEAGRDDAVFIELYRAT